MDSPINPDIIAFASDFALTVNALGAVIFGLVMRRLWIGHEKQDAARRGVHSKVSAAEPCLG
jgi:hypothetical protein